MTALPTLRPGAIALVTGASSGIGRAVVESLVKDEAKVICVGRDESRLAELCSAYPDRTLPLSLDVTDARAVAGVLDNLPEDWRAIDILIANAGSDVGGRRAFAEGEMSDWASTIETNVTGVMRICHAILPDMLRRGHGHVVTVGSIAGQRTYPGGAAYSASKFAVRAFTDALRKDYKHDPIRITEVLPGLVRTGFAAARFKGDAEKGEAFYDSFPDSLKSEDIAASVMFALTQPQSVNIARIVVVPTGDK
jgi:NADP-dependent 3-hydroxy acid dehydrogenase YdfG